MKTENFMLEFPPVEIDQHPYIRVLDGVGTLLYYLGFDKNDKIGDLLDVIEHFRESD